MTETLDRRINAYRPDLADARLRGQIEAERFVEGVPMRVERGTAALRREPRAAAMQETEALFGERVHVFETDSDGWSWVQLDADGYVGWMEASALGEAGAAATHRVSAPSTLLFPEPDIKRPSLAILPMGARVAKAGEAEDRNATYAIVEPAGAVVVQHLAAVGDAAPDFVAVAERFVGAPYLWGGRTVAGIDCSGLVQIALAMAGHAAPRDTDMQETALGARIAGIEPLRRGDLVFWRGHVGIMLDGERLIHANAFHMATAVEPLAETVRRYEAKGVAVSSIRRLG
ncbi:C40 family peptidase [Aureimonas leprariae]|uniref:NlpC/P60 family protein n=1 Tax=Plantimonas leprariae TaxID=2615207 RepID=A0A7V7PSW0_9HYPH|nr:NlpC/P60 family protein [Aureimonas leprariae]KAB0682700.1 NlpC/P60 family protein [Aureimonas leprariae]